MFFMLFRILGLFFLKNYLATNVVCIISKASLTTPLPTLFLGPAWVTPSLYATLLVIGTYFCSNNCKAYYNQLFRHLSLKQIMFLV